MRSGCRRFGAFTCARGSFCLHRRRPSRIGPTNGLYFVYCERGTDNTCSSLGDLVDTADNIIYWHNDCSTCHHADHVCVGRAHVYVSRENPRGSQGKTDTHGRLNRALLIVLGAWLIVNTFANVLGIRIISADSADSASIEYGTIKLTLSSTVEADDPCSQS